MCICYIWQEAQCNFSSWINSFDSFFCILFIFCFPQISSILMSCRGDSVLQSIQSSFGVSHFHDFDIMRSCACYCKFFFILLENIFASSITKCYWWGMIDTHTLCVWLISSCFTNSCSSSISYQSVPLFHFSMARRHLIEKLFWKDKCFGQSFALMAFHDSMAWVSNTPHFLTSHSVSERKTINGLYANSGETLLLFFVVDSTK